MDHLFKAILGLLVIIFALIYSDWSRWILVAIGAIMIISSLTGKHTHRTYKHIEKTQKYKTKKR